MATFQNLGFEDAGVSAGEADQWTVNTTFSVEEIAGYGTPELPEERFETEWDSNEDFLWEFEPSDLSVSSYDENDSTNQTFTATPATDEITLSNHGYHDGTIAVLTNSGGALPAPLVAARNYRVLIVDSNTFKFAELGSLTPIDITDAGTGTHYSRLFVSGLDPESVEDYEEGWKNNQVFETELLSTDVASYDTTPEDFEDFEEDWDNSREWTLTDRVIYILAAQAGNYTVTLNGKDFTYNASGSDTPSDIATALAGLINANGIPVVATPVGATVELEYAAPIVPFLLSVLGPDDGTIAHGVLETDTGIDAAPYDTTPAEDYEDFEDEWNNDAFETSIASPDPAIYDDGTDNKEDFDEASLPQVFTVDVSLDKIQASSHGFSNGDEVFFTSTEALPEGLLENTSFVVASATANDFQVTRFGTTVDIVDSGSGTLYVKGNPKKFWTLAMQTY